MRLSYFVMRNQDENLDFTCSLLTRYYPQLAAAGAATLRAADCGGGGRLRPTATNVAGRWAGLVF